MVPGLISGIISIFASWFWMAVVFHRFQKETPDTWRREGPLHYLCASILRLIAAMGISCLFILIVRFNVAFFGASLSGSMRFAFGGQYVFRSFWNLPPLSVCIGWWLWGNCSTG